MNAQTRQPQLIALDVLLKELGHFFRKAAQKIMVWEQKYKTRRELANLDPRLWKDIGLTQYDVEKEQNKPFWS